jgi:protein TonB
MLVYAGLFHTSPLSPASKLGAEARMRRPLFGSLLLHAAIAALLIGIPWTSSSPDPPLLEVKVVFDEPGSAGAAGGSAGGGGEDQAGRRSEAAAEPEPPVESTTAEIAAEPVPPEVPVAPPTERVTSPLPPSPDGLLAPLPAPQPTPPKAKPRPPQRPVTQPKPPKAPPAPVQPAMKPTPVEPVPATPAPPSRSQVAAAAPPAGAAPTGETGEGASPRSGSGQGTEGTGRGSIGEGPLEGPGDDYLERLRAWLARYKEYPDEAFQKKQEGRVYVSFTVHRDGQLTDPRLERSSGSAALDAATMKLLRVASPVPRLPAAYRLDQARLVMPISYSIGFFDKIFR